jgi:hypothetical protein
VTERHPKQIYQHMFRSGTAFERALIGKTIAAVDLLDGDVMIRFEDGTFVCGEARSGECCGDYGSIDWDATPEALGLSLLGVITEEEYRDAERRRVEQDKARKREQLARLKAELGEV